MKKLFFYSLFLSAFIFTNCKKEPNDPMQNRLVVVDQSGNTTISQPVEAELYGAFDGPSSFAIGLKSPTTDYGFSMNFRKGLEASPVIFHSDGNLDGTNMWLGHPVTGIWLATGGKANIVSKSTFPGSTGEPKVMQINFNNVEFTRSPFNSPTPSPDTIWVSGNITVGHR